DLRRQHRDRLGRRDHPAGGPPDPPLALRQRRRRAEEGPGTRPLQHGLDRHPAHRTRCRRLGRTPAPRQQDARGGEDRWVEEEVGREKEEEKVRMTSSPPNWITKKRPSATAVP